MYTVVFKKTAEKEFSKLDKYSQKQIQIYINKYIASSNPRENGKALRHNWAGHWRYDIGKYRIICDIQDDICTIVVIKVGHRREVYRQK